MCGGRNAVRGRAGGRLVHALQLQCLDTVAADHGRNKTLIKSQERGIVRRCNCYQIRIGDLLMSEEPFEAGLDGGEFGENIAIQMMFVGC